MENTFHSMDVLTNLVFLFSLWLIIHGRISPSFVARLDQDEIALWSFQSE